MELDMDGIVFFSFVVVVPYISKNASRLHYSSFQVILYTMFLDIFKGQVS